jgi:hypothetical protein
MLLTAGTMIDQRIAAAPSVIASQAPTPPLTTEWQQNQPDEMEVFGTPGEATANQLPQFLRYGPLWIRPHADYRFMYGNGLQATAGNQQASAIHELAPGLLFNLGSHWSLDYTPTLRFYSNSKFRDTVDHALALNGGLRYADWVLGFSHGSQFTTTPLAETGAQTEQTTHATGITASHALNSKVSTDLSLNQQINLVTGFRNSYTWSTLDWVNYQFWPRLSIGLGGGGGYVMVEDNSHTQGTGNLDQTYEQLQARINWRATQKISFQVNGGLEDRQFSTAGSDDSLNPIFGASIQYQPFKRTQISLSASRTVSSSDYYLAAQQSETTTVGVNMDQRLLKKFNLGLGVGYAKTDFNTASGAAGGNRGDETVSFNARLSHPFLKRGNWSLFYQFSDNRSSQPGFGFQSNQTGFEISYRY